MVKKIVTERYYVEGSTFNVVDWEIYTYPVIEKWTDFNAKVVYDVLSTDFRRLKNSSVFSFFFSEAEKAYHWVVEKVETVNIRSKQYFFITLVATTSVVQTPKLDINTNQLNTSLVENVVVQPIIKNSKTFRVTSVGVQDTFVDITNYSKFKKKLADSKINNIRKTIGVQRVANLDKPKLKQQQANFTYNNFATEKLLHFNPADVNVYSGVKAKNLANPHSSDVYKKFISFEAGMVYFKRLIEQHNRECVHKINVKALLCQIRLESGFKVDGKGFCDSRLATFGNNFLGLKGGGRNGMLSVDDDRDKNGNLKASSFERFRTPSDCIKGYCKFVYATGRYTGSLVDVEKHHKHKHKGCEKKRYFIQRHLESNDYIAYLKELNGAGYSTSNDYVSQCFKLNKSFSLD